MVHGVEGFSKETYGGLYSVYTRGRLKSIFPARSGRNKTSGTMDRPVCVRSPSTKITGRTARDLIQSSFLPGGSATGVSRVACNWRKALSETPLERGREGGGNEVETRMGALTKE